MQNRPSTLDLSFNCTSDIIHEEDDLDGDIGKREIDENNPYKDDEVITSPDKNA